MLVRLHGLSCIDGDRSECKGSCEHAAGTYLGDRWERCPRAELERERNVLAVWQLRNLARLNALSDFPEKYSAGAVKIWQELEAADSDRRDSERDHG